MRYKIMVNGTAYKARYANGSYLPDISKSGYAFLAVYYDNNLMATGERITVGLGGFGVTILGVLADKFGLPMVMQLLVWLPIVAAITAIWIPIPKKLQK